ncbi:MAG: MFS transporter [Promethearchaeota archaeon]
MSENRKLGISEKKHSMKSILSYNSLSFGVNLSGYIFAARLIFFYETEILLPIALITLAITIYTAYDMINDPIIGHFCDRNYKFTKRWGKRFPWIILSVIPLSFITILYFIPPDPAINVWATFYWFLLILILQDTFGSTLSVNYLALTPTKYRSKEERVKVATIARIFVTAGTVLGFILPPMFIEYGDKTSYIPLAIIAAIVLLISMLFSIPGMREEKELIDAYFQIVVKKEPFFKEFKSMIKKTVKQKNFLVYLILSLTLGIHTSLLVSSIPYFARYVAKAGPSFEIIVYIPWILTGVLLLPFFFWLINKYGHQQVFRKSICLIPFSTIPLFICGFFTDNLLLILLSAAFMGAINGLNNILLVPTVADFFDEAALLNNKRQEGIYNGLLIFFGNLTQIVQIVVFWLVHELTGFIPNVIDQTDLALFGILFIMSIIPMICTFIGVAIFLKYWDLTPEKTEEIKERLVELGL